MQEAINKKRASIQVARTIGESPLSWNKKYPGYRGNVKAFISQEEETLAKMEVSLDKYNETHDKNLDRLRKKWRIYRK